MKTKTQFNLVWSCVALAGSIACAGQSSTGVSFHVPQGNASALTAQVGNDTLVLTSAEVVLRKVELERDGGKGCDPNASAGASDGGCPTLKDGPFIVSLPLNGNISTSFAASIPAGTYKEIKFQLHKLSGANDQNTLAARPDMDGSSVKVMGSFNGNDFTLLSDVTAVQDFTLDPALTVSADKPYNLTVSIDVQSWLKDATGAFVDPASAQKGADGEARLKQAILASFRSFEDNNQDGEQDKAASK